MIPFSFNLPQRMPSDTTPDGANLTYLHNQPAAQLLYGISRHRVAIWTWNPACSANIPLEVMAPFFAGKMSDSPPEISKC